eukprot:TRINITY_DN282_c0_g1_i2.p1 TRINITY_DN282_c0_g1~~TRINITY_DN282_c0_g1_i2.p1  ORF type:complete len:350 (+),score=108.39 TRINITY_DN282_c0_g1_i2:45-1052(+)
MSFFARQKVDEVGVVGVSLQKALIFLMVVAGTGFFVRGMFLMTLLSIMILWAGFMGAYRRRPCLLAFYFWVNIFLYILSVVFAIVLIFVVLNSPQMNSSSSSSSDSQMSISSPVSHLFGFPGENPFAGSDSSSSSSSDSSDSESSSAASGSSSAASGSSSAASDSSSSWSDSISESVSSMSESWSASMSESWASMSSDSYEGPTMAVMIVISIVAMIFGFLVFFFKIYSLVLAYRMRKMILAQRALTCAPTSNSCVDEEKANPGYPASSINTTSNDVAPQAAAPAAAPAPQPVMMYMPYPYAQQGMQAMPMMSPYGQAYGQPVYYTYQPVPQNQQ